MKPTDAKHTPATALVSLEDIEAAGQGHLQVCENDVVCPRMNFHLCVATVFGGKNLESDTLASLLGYATPPALSVGGVLDAVRADPRLDTAGRELLTSVYRWLVRRRSVGDGRS